MFAIEVWEKGSWKELKNTRKASKKDLTEEVTELNKIIDQEQLKFIPFKNKYRVKKVKN